VLGRSKIVSARKMPVFFTLPLPWTFSLLVLSGRILALLILLCSLDYLLF